MDNPFPLPISLISPAIAYIHRHRMRCVYFAGLVTIYMCYTNYPQSIVKFLDFIPDLTSDSKLSTTKYLVSTPGCKIIDFDPFSPDVKPYFKPTKPVACNPAFFRLKDGMLAVNLTVTKTWKIDNLKCCYRAIHRVSQNPKKYNSLADKKIRFSENCTNVPLGEKTVIHDSYIKVECGNETTNVKIDYGSQVLPLDSISNETSRKRAYWVTKRKAGLPLPPNIVVVGIDSVSRLHMIRSLPKTREFLLKNDFIEMKGYTKIADYTLGATMGAFGGMELGKYPCWPKRSVKVDDCPLIWKNYSRLNYVTAYLEDAPNMAIYNYGKTGFVLPPADYYLRPYMLALRKTKGACASGTEPSAIVTNFMLQIMSEMISDVPYFLFSWLSSVPHETFRGLQNLDNLFLDFFTISLNNATGNPDNTIYLFMGDHGYRAGNFRETFQGYYEVNLPLMHIRLPPSLKQAHPDWYANLVTNSAMMTSTLDVHTTLKHVLHEAEVLTGATNFTESGWPFLSEEYRPRYSFFERIPGNRTCETSSISEEYCMCGVTAQVKESTNVEEFAGVVINHVNSILQSEIKSGLCVNLTFSKFLYGRELNSPDTLGDIKYKDHLIAVEVKPSNAHFETRLRVFHNMTIEIIGEVQRINLYKDQSHCVNDRILKSYCFCTDKLPKPTTKTTKIANLTNTPKSVTRTKTKQA